MKRTKRILSLLLLLSTLILTACEDLDDPYDRIQGEPGEDSTQDVGPDDAGGDVEGGVDAEGDH